MTTVTYSFEEIEAARIMRAIKGYLTTDLDIGKEVHEFLMLAEKIKLRMLERAAQDRSSDRSKTV